MHRLAPGTSPQPAALEKKTQPLARRKLHLNELED